jgi:hypothetical protein
VTIRGTGSTASQPEVVSATAPNLPELIAFMEDQANDWTAEGLETIAGYATGIVAVLRAQLVAVSACCSPASEAQSDGNARERLYD